MLPQLSPSLRVAEAARLSHLHPRLAAAFARTKQKYIAHFPEGNRPFLVCSYRSNEEQAKLYEQGRTTPGPIVTYAKAGQSRHNSRPAEAFDVGFITDHYEQDFTERQYTDFYQLLHEDYPEIEWGGLWKKRKDKPHFQLPDGKK